MTELIVEELECIKYSLEYIVDEGTPDVRDEAIKSKAKLELVIKLLERGV